MKTPEKDIFFVGYQKKLPPGLRRFIPVVALALIILAATFGYGLVRQSDVPDAGRFRWDFGPQEVTGVVRMAPYPTLTVSEATERFQAGRVLLLSGQGKRGPNLGDASDGDVVQLRGIVIQRGALEMLQVGRRMASQAQAPDLPADEPLGRWKLTGEICDGKCLAGAMRPGTGLAHKACANLCLTGDVPPVFVASEPLINDLVGSEFLLVAGPEGGAMAPSLLDQVGSFVEIEGEVIRRQDLLIFHADPATVKVL